MSDTTEQAPSDATEQADTTPTFADLGLSDQVLKAIREIGYETPSAIQAATIPTLLDGRDVVGLAQTGTGKTAAFALPILSRLDVSAKKPQALVLSPTRELALQVCEAFEQFASGMRGVHVLPVYGGQAYGVQLSALRRGVHVVVGTPGRIMDHLAKGTLDLSELKYLVLDEADEMLKMGFAEDVETILADTPDDKQVALFSATMPPQIRRISKQYLNDAEEITVKAKTTTSVNTTQRYLMVSYPQKVDALTRILEVENFEGMIIFVRTKSETETLAEKLRARGYSAAAISGDVAQAQRERTVNQLKSGKLDILVATDVAARGLDVDRISHVVNYDIPIDTESYVHRIGRTGRAGRSGAAISFVTPRERRLLGAIEKATRQPLTQMQLPTVEDVNSTRLTRFDDAITEALSQDSRISAFRDIISHYVEHHDVPEADVAAALAVVAQGETPLLLDPKDERPQRDERPLRERDDRAPRGGRDDDRGERRERGPRTSKPMTAYRIEVGRRHRVEPRQIVGALANEGGLSRDDFGAIQIRPDFSVVELASDVSTDMLDRLSDTRISGKLIEIKPDRRGGAPRRDDRPDRSQGGERPARKPRY
ncbi:MULTISPECIES: DEAD/DEAH box helicase [unclassified Frigoribacterium]|jgi:ATP-dependent RNA helicase DeaD|uniref:DEAD/DEAH box helicase n=1 Tax=unclassified Frigoribacterium TaxID=2627005 RepID=UPI0005B8134B|nr:MULTISPECIES: DEAD/DEAH box helicase [unclassified Frigoribacterium]KIU03020.1 cold-shock protein [Frigoribacterium sp. MEB024]KQN39188.1 cold-shock protein [Frigoribacterium sp. Leaf44]KQO47222.1 cold-shock protein [Frigoribacterium sp. Leaf254]KQT39314.1 cold-shock protein [Frigoribacterium sp. Leaf415]MBD8540485.1 DEAD/DEAH box helicase [Frigoribacterium sp. CFBP 8751]